ncbi:PREDICTED: LOW QUALITY PROTEIN: histone-lysine N-methyltransferase 2E [Habropoda laboriosa]|uniref:LOW QUALITY PROTEIN: histone-lysine N-methyltransferase 2E n=1 Tax=Habropoda laboriosa TaxID=597456 RepID=UPI00083CFF97|nr:PREDICTED: LOW QUALITY PROTEIN: histone-lysine N-methyltransferase 2E [Habropoda laboriosa]
MSFVLQLGTVETSLEKKNSSGQPSSSLNQETTGTLVGGTDDSNKPQILQCLESTSEISAGHVISFSTVKSVSVTYPVAKTVREVQRITGPQTNTTQVLTTRVISQKLPSSTHQTQSTTPLTLNASTNVVHVPVNTQSLPSPGSGLTHVYPLQHAVSTQAKQQQARNQVGSCESKQQTSTVPSLQTSSVPLKVQPVSSQLMVSSSAVRAISTATSLPNIQRIHVKAQNLVGQGQTVNLQKVKAVTNVNQGVTVQRNTVPRIQTVQKSQVSTGTVQTAQFAVNQVTNNANAQRAQQGNSALQKAQANAAASMQKVAQVYNNQKVPSQVLSSHPNHKAQLQQIATGNQQQGLQKLQVQPQKTVTTVPRQQQSATTPVNNVQKPSNSVAGIQKVQVVGQVQCQQQSSQVQKHVQQVQPSHHQRSQSTAALQKSQTVATVNSSRVQTITNVCKSNSVPNITKASQNANLLAVNKQQVISQPQQSQQVHPAQNSSQLQQQLLQQTSQTQQQSQQHVVQKQQQQQQQQANANPPTQRSHSISNVHQKVATIATMPNNQRTQVMNSKMQQQQQQMVMRVGVPKNQAQTLQQGNMKSIPQKMANTVKPANSQNAVQQSLHRAANSQPVKIIQQQQNVIGPQNAQKQPGCIKTIPPQKPAQRNHAQKVAGIKTSLNTNVTAVKSQGPTTAVAQKTSIKTLLPQQTVASNMLMHKNQPIKIQQQGVQQKQLIATSQFPQQVRQQSGQVKTLLPVTSTEPRKDVENKTEPESREPKEDERQQRPTSPIIRIPPPYECLQYVLQDHNYGAPPPRTPSPPSPPSHPKQPINGAGSSTATSQHAYIYGKVVSGTNVEDDAASAISSETGRDVELEGEETETAPEGEGDDEDSVTRCICDFEHDDGYMICCDRCLVWQHVDCMGIDRSNIPDEYLCEICRPRRVDRQRARALQMRKREELLNSDTSSDTSSTSSADTDVGVNTIPKKRTLQQQVPRRKSEPPQVRRLNNNNNNNNNNVAKRQRRDSHPRQSSAVRKKETTKRGPGKRKVKRRMSLEDKEEDSQDAWSSTNVTPLRQWIERYEEAVTNHYSPELRARISSIKVNGTHSDLRQSNMSMIATGKCRLNVHSNNVRFLVATMYLQPNTPVVELRGKYMLSTQHRPSYPQGRQHSQRPGPFVFFYRLPRDGTEVCVDTRTYGNDARFVRRSCKPNAEVKHCIEKGTLHLYIVTTTAIEKNAEITIRHEQHDLLLSPNPNGPIMPIVCACNNPRECQIVSLNQLNRRGSNGTLAENADGRERRRRGRRNTVCEDSDSSTAIPNSTVIAQPVPPPTIVSTVSAPPRRTVTTTVTNTVRQVPKEEPPIVSESKKDKKKMTREERKMEAIMKAFERLEKAEQRKQEVQARNAQRKESGGTHSDNDDAPSVTVQSSKQKQQTSDRPLRRKRRKGRARTTSQSQSSSRRTRLNSADSDESSGEESNSLQSPPLLSQNHSQNRDAPYSSHLHTPAKNTNENVATSGGGHQGIPTAAGLLLALANSNAPGPSSPPLQQPTPVKSPTCDSGASSSSQSSTPSTPLSSACLLVAAAVGPLAPGFKFPKTKKVLMNEWLKESPDPPQSNISQVSPLPALPPTSASNSINPLCRSSDFSLPTDSSAEFLTQSYAAKSLATLVQAANSVSGICDSPPQKKQAISGNNTVCPVSTGSAKKRWLRQAISEECDSPNSRPESPPPSEMVAPPKKRRIARESLSSDNYTPPTTPTMLVPESTPNNRSLCPVEDDFIEQLQSPLIEQNDERHTMTESVKQEVNSHEHVNSDETMRQKLSVDIPQNFHVKSIKSEESMTVVQIDASLVKEENLEVKKEEYDEMECDAYIHLESKPSVKDEYRAIKNDTDHQRDKSKKEHVIKKEVEHLEVEKGTVEIVDQNEEGDTEMEDFSSPIALMESDAILKQRVAEMKLEFGGSISEMVKIENEKCDDDKRSEDAKSEVKSDDNMSIDEFDVEAQMKKITGDDGNDYKEKVDTSSEKDKSMDGIEGLMESSKEDSESEDKDMDDVKYETSFKSFNINHEEKLFKEFENKTEPECIIENNTKETEQSQESQKTEQLSALVTSSEESIFESTSSNMDAESIAEPPKIFHSIPPLSERIRKKTETTSTPKSQLNFEAAIIESTIDMETVDGSKNGEQKSMLSTALRELLEAKLDDLASDSPKEETIEENNTPYIEPKSESPEQIIEVQESVLKPAPQIIQNEEVPPVKEEEAPPKEIKRLKDPRTVVPNTMPAPAFKPDTIPPVKRKLSISEYRKRKQQSSGTPPEPEPSNDASATDKGGARGRSDSASSGTSSLSSDEEGSKISLSLDIPSLTALPLFTNAESEEKKGGEEGTIGWSAAPTLVERQRENLTERLKREFGLFLSDDEEERARKHGLTAEAILKARKTSPPHPSVSNTPPGYPVPQLPPQPYIPPPGSASIHYPQFQSKPPCPVQYPNFTVPQSTSQPIYTNAAPQASANKQAQQFLVPQASQAPPGSNPYPPQFIPPSTTAVSISKYSSVTPPSGNQMYPASGQSQKQFYNHPAPRS